MSEENIPPSKSRFEGRRLSTSDVSDDDVDNSPSQMDEELPDVSIKVLIDAWDLYHTALGIAYHGAQSGDSGYITLAAVALRHVFEYFKYDPCIDRWSNTTDTKDIHKWVGQKWSGYKEIINIANATKHVRLERRSGKPLASFKRYETEMGYSSVYNLQNGIVDISVSTILTLTDESGVETSVNVEDTLDEGFAFAYKFFECHFPEKIERRPLPDAWTNLAAQE